MTNKDALERMDALRKDRKWLSESTGYSINSLYNTFGGKTRELKERMNTAFERAFAEEERRQNVNMAKPDASVWDLVYFNGKEVETISRAKVKGGYDDLAKFYRDAVITFADGILADEVSEAAEKSPAQLESMPSPSEGKSSRSGSA